MKLNARFDGVKKRFAATMAENSASIGIDMGEVHIVPSIPGEPGVSPIVEMQETAEGVDITITDAEGVKTATVKHGLKGEQGERGEKGEPGERGEPGYTPVKGVDYFDGQPGKDGEPGKDGYTPQKGVDYFDGSPGKDGKDGEPGKDGYTPQKGVDYFDGLPGKDGKDGEPGKDGYTPIKGTDYWTEEDKQNIVDEVLAELPEGGVGVDVTEETNTYTQLLDDLERTVEELPEAGVQFETDETLTLENGILSVNTADAVEADNTLPVTSAAVFAEVGNINALLGTI